MGGALAFWISPFLRLMLLIFTEVVYGLLIIPTVLAVEG